MPTTFWVRALLVGVLTLGSPLAWAQAPPAAQQGFGLSAADLALTFTTERNHVTPSTSGGFWLHGGSLDGGMVFFHGLGAAANMTIERAGGIAPGVSLSKVSIMAGPRYTLRLGAKHENRLFIESLFGGAFALNSVFPTSTGITTNADSFSLQIGGGWDLAIAKNVAIRVLEADYVRTDLPNNGTNTQDYLRLAFGVSYHFQRH